MYTADLSAWSQVVRELGSIDMLLLAVELPLEDIPEKLKSAVQELRRARIDLVAARYDMVVSCMRLVMDATELVFTAKQSLGTLTQTFADGETREAMPKHSRAALIRAAIRHYTHLAHHLNAQGEITNFNRHEATFVLAVAVAAVWDAIGRELARR